MRVTYALVGVVLLVSVTGMGFLVDPFDASDPDPAPFGETLTLGMTSADVNEAEEDGYSIPRAEVFFSQYQYVIGYYGVESAASHLTAPYTERQFGPPLEVLVTDYSGTELRLSDGGYLVEGYRGGGGWIPARTAVFVVDSRARTPAGPAVVPFSDRDDAERFAEGYGGDVVDWQGVLARSQRDESPTADMARHVSNRTEWADRQVTATAPLTERPVSVVVGRDVPTLAAAIDRAPPNTTVRLPPGTYDGNVTVDKPLTLAGAGSDSHVAGDGTGTVIDVSAPRSAVTDLRVTGVGPNGSRSLANLSDEEWDQRIRVAYGQGDAAVRFEDANQSLATGLTIETDANGILARASDGLVVRDSNVTGPDEWPDGFMGVLAMFDPVVVQNVTFEGGRDGVYTHRAHGVVVRNSRMEGLRYGVHEMYTSRALVVNNTARDTYGGIIVMTRPRRNALVGNEVTDSRAAITVAGTASFVADNVVSDNEIGLSVAAPQSLVTGNVVVDNDIGVRADTLLPSLTVVGNDIVANRQAVSAGGGPVRIWTADGRGNYWGALPGRSAGGETLTTTYRPTGPIDGGLLGTPGGVTLRDSPAVTLLRTVQDRLPGLRASGVIDTAPLVDPVHPETLDRLNTTA
ncbi:NosD domain-containing protein [Halorientalis litorea]|uniref:NosD domain-containing protein n=1 Tax=Halorientalis litorea TaxID=2931977 RepID=UPI001FF41B3B|nr:NosD domain-containing protein [Halorientalis litorea]